MSSSSTFQPSFFSWISWPGSGLSWNAPELDGPWNSIAVVDLFSTFISGCSIGDPYQLGLDAINHWKIPDMVHAVENSSFIISNRRCCYVGAGICQESRACGDQVTCMQVFLLLQLVIWFSYSILHLKKIFTIGLFLWANMRRGKKLACVCSLIFSQYPSLENQMLSVLQQIRVKKRSVTVLFYQFLNLYQVQISMQIQVQILLSLIRIKTGLLVWDLTYSLHKNLNPNKGWQANCLLSSMM